MKNLLMIALLTAAACATGCAPAASNVNSNLASTNANVNANTTAKTAPTKEALTALETRAFEAWKNKDAAFFEGFLTRNFVSFTDKGERPDRASTIKMITVPTCDVKGYAFSDEKITNITSDVAVLTLKATADYTCDGKAGPSPVISATVYVREGEAWKAAYHNEVPVVGTNAGPVKPGSANSNQASASPAKPMASRTVAATSNTGSGTANSTGTTTAVNSGPNTNANSASGDALTAELTALEITGWETWKARDAKKMEEMVAKEMTFVDIMGNVQATRADTMKTWMESKCEVKSVSVTDTKAYSITSDVAILTFKGGATGNCEGMPLKPLWGTTVFVKEGGVWKTSYMFETPA